MRNKKVLFTTQAAMIAALYVVLTMLANALGLANHAIQVRFSEALTILPYFTPAAIPGLTIGCVISNLLTGCMPLDVVFGSCATLLGAVGTYLFRKYKLGSTTSTDHRKYHYRAVYSCVCLYGRGNNPVFYADSRHRRSDLLWCVRNDIAWSFRKIQACDL